MKKPALLLAAALSAAFTKRRLAPGGALAAPSARGCTFEAPE